MYIQVCLRAIRQQCRTRKWSSIAKVGGTALAAVLSTQCASDPQNSTSAELLVPSSQKLAGAATFGMGCQTDFQNGYLATLSYAWDNCWSFWNSAVNFMDGKWAYNLQGGRYWWQQPNGYGNNVNTVEFFFSSTHGGAWTGSNTWGYTPTAAVYGMWENPYGDSRQMLAYTAPGWASYDNINIPGMPLTVTEGLFTYACDTHKNDGNIVTRWYPVFAGGLRVATGGWDVLWDGYTNSDDGANFADNLGGGYSFAWAWSDGISDWNTTNHPSTMVTGTGPNDSDCTNRLYNMTAQNRLQYPKYTSANISWMCWSQITD